MNVFLVRIFSEKPPFIPWLTALSSLIIMLQAMFVRIIPGNFLPPLRLAGIDLT